MQSITPKELVSLLEKSPEKIELIDVRGTGEYNESHIPEARNIPMHLIPMRLSEIDTKKKIIPAKEPAINMVRSGPVNKNETKTILPRKPKNVASAKIQPFVLIVNALRNIIFPYK